MQRILITLLCTAPLVLSGCGRVPKATKTRDSGQSGLMDESFAAQNRCNPKNHLRPFIIEWDGTDMSSFEAVAANDIVFVRYEGCELTVLEACRNDSIRGESGAYRPVEWTTGQLEKMQIANEGELYAKLPLGSATLGGRVAGGEKFAMEYYVAGTRNATRDSVYRDDIGKNPACRDATHFVYGYNLGAFALGTTKKFEAEAGVSAFGFGAGGKTSSNSQVDKKGGDLGVCKSDTATEVSGCKAPIRLTLRKVFDGNNPDKEAMTSTDSDAALNAAGQVNAKVELNEKARAHFDSAREKLVSKDGKGCIAELDSADKADAKHKSTDPKSLTASWRAWCLMTAAKCDAGKVLLRKHYEATTSFRGTSLDSAVDSSVANYCQGKLPPRDELLKAYQELTIMGNPGSGDKPTVKDCTDRGATVLRLKKTVKPRDEEDTAITNIGDENYIKIFELRCLARAGDCKGVYTKYVNQTWPDKAVQKNLGDKELRSSFDSQFQVCKGKPIQ